MVYVVTRDEKPKPCQKCGSKSLALRRKLSDSAKRKKKVSCRRCNYGGPWSTTVVGAVKMWNEEVLRPELLPTPAST